MRVGMAGCNQQGAVTVIRGRYHCFCFLLNVATFTHGGHNQTPCIMNPLPRPAVAILPAAPKALSVLTQPRTARKPSESEYHGCDI